MLPSMTRRAFGGLAQVVGMLALVNVLGVITEPTISRAEAQSARAAIQKPLKVVAFGDSLFAGYGLKPSQAFPVQLQKALKARGHNVAIANAGVSGDTTAGGLKRLAWAVPDDADAVILELGANDALRGIDPDVTRANLEKIVAQLKQRNIPILLAGMRSPANWGEHYSDTFDAIFPALAREYGLLFYPFFLDGVVLDPKLNQNDGMHPNRKGVAEIVKRIIPSVEELIARATAHKDPNSKS